MAVAVKAELARATQMPQAAACGACTGVCDAAAWAGRESLVRGYAGILEGDSQ